MKKIKFKTKDNVEICGSFNEALDPGAPAVLLLHMMPADKESWREFQEKLKDAGFQSLAIDMRGHGKSVLKNEKKISYLEFGDAEQQEKIYDVEAAMEFLAARSIESDRVAIAGASIGANLALEYQTRHKEIKAAVLLSAGLNYRDIETEPLARQISENQAVFLAGAKRDTRGSGSSCADMAQTLFDLLPSRNRKLAIFDGAEHGTNLFEAYPELMGDVIDWLKEIYF